jgi:hypothetical protein
VRSPENAQIASRGVRLNWREVLRAEAREYFRMRVSVRGKGMSVMRVTPVSAPG